MRKLQGIYFRNSSLLTINLLDWSGVFYTIYMKVKMGVIDSDSIKVELEE